MSFPYLPTLYKARKVPAKQVVCAICVERTRGRTRAVELGYGVRVHLCAGHSSREFHDAAWWAGPRADAAAAVAGA